MAEKSNRQSISEEQALKLVKERWNTFIDNTSQFRKKLIDYYRQYKGIPNRKNYDGLANIFVNETLEAVESIVAQEYNLLFSEPRYLHLRGREETDEKRALVTENLMFQALDEMSAKSKITDSIRQRVTYGTCVGEVPWRIEEKEIFKRVKLEDGNFDFSEIKTAVYDNPNLQYIDLLDVALDPGKSRIEDMDWVIIRKEVSIDTIKQRARQGVYGNVDLSETDSYRQSKQSTAQSFNKDNKMNSLGINYQELREGKHEILKMWGKVPRWWIDDDVDLDKESAGDMVEGVIEIMDQKTTIRLHRNPYWHQKKPVLISQYIRFENEAFGIGVAQIVERLQEELNDKRNQLLDHASLTILPPLVKQRQANIPNEQIQLKPHKIISSDLPGNQAIQPLQIGGNPNEIYLMDGVIKQDIRNNSGATNPIQGIKSPGDSTAFEVNLLNQKSNSRINVYASDFAETFLKPFYKMVYQLLQQYLTKEKAIKIVGKDGVRWERIMPEDLIADLDFIPKVPTDMDSRVIIRNQMIQYIGVVARLYPQINIYMLARKIYILFGFDDVDEVIPRPDLERGQNEISEEEELFVLSLGQKIEVKYFQDHVKKIDAAVNWLRANQGNLTEQARSAFEDYIYQHTQYLRVLESIQATLGAGVGARVGGTNLTQAPTVERGIESPAVESMRVKEGELTRV